MGERTHPFAAGLGVVAAILLLLGVGEYYGYITPTNLGLLYPDAFFLLFVVALAAAVGVYLIEDRP
jgi:hypothetical protein